MSQKPWRGHFWTRSIYNALRTNTTACIKSSQSVTWGNTRLPLIKSTERNLTPEDWPGSRTITDCNEKPSSCLAGELKIFYVHFEGRKPTYHLVDSRQPLWQSTTWGGLDPSEGEFIRRFLKGSANEPVPVIYLTTASSPHASNSQI